jgi:hypothetical protein
MKITQRLLTYSELYSYIINEVKGEILLTDVHCVSEDKDRYVDVLQCASPT